VTLHAVTSQDAGTLICMAGEPQIVPFEIDQYILFLMLFIYLNTKSKHVQVKICTLIKLEFKFCVQLGEEGKRIDVAVSLFCSF
jgi:hypothetical protein